MTNLSIACLSHKRLPDLERFLKLIHPQLDNPGERILWFTFRTPFLRDKQDPPALLALNKEDKIAGQFMLNNQEWFYGGVVNQGFFGYDFFIKESYRKSGIGALLLIRAVRQYNPFFGVGLTGPAEKLYEAAKVKEIGRLKKFLWINEPFSSLRHILCSFFKPNYRMFGANCNTEFPAGAYSGSLVFKLAQTPVLEKYAPYYDPAVIEFSRSKEFLRWRYFDSDIKYHFYYCSDYDVPLFFVVRPVLRKGLNLLSLVDYKVPVDDHIAWLSVLEAAKKIAKKMGFDGLVSAGSHVFFNQGFKKRGFLTVGKSAPIVSTILRNPLPEKGAVEGAIYITMGDADLDLNFGDEQ